MPVMIQIRNVPDKVHRALKARSALAGKPKPVAAVAAEALLRMDPRRALAVTQDAPTNNDSMLLTPLWDDNQTRARLLPEFAEFARRAGLARLWDKLGPPDLCSKNDKGDYVCH